MTLCENHDDEEIDRVTIAGHEWVILRCKVCKTVRKRPA